MRAKLRQQGAQQRACTQRRHACILKLRGGFVPDELDTLRREVGGGWRAEPLMSAPPAVASIQRPTTQWGCCYGTPRLRPR